MSTVLVPPHLILTFESESAPRFQGWARRLAGQHGLTKFKIELRCHTPPGGPRPPGPPSESDLPTLSTGSTWRLGPGLPAPRARAVGLPLACLQVCLCPLNGARHWQPPAASGGSGVGTTTTQ